MVTKNIILSKSKNTKKTRSRYIINFQCFYFPKTENKKSNQTYFQNSNLLKMKIVFRQWNQEMKTENENANQTHLKFFPYKLDQS